MFDIWREKSEKQQKWRIVNVVQIGQTIKPGLRIFGPAADKRDLTTFCNKLTNTQFKIVKKSHFFPVIQRGSFMRDA